MINASLILRAVGEASNVCRSLAHAKSVHFRVAVRTARTGECKGAEYLTPRTPNEQAVYLLSNSCCYSPCPEIKQDKPGKGRGNSEVRAVVSLALCRGKALSVVRTLFPSLGENLNFMTLSSCCHALSRGRRLPSSHTNSLATILAWCIGNMRRGI